ncbi:MAG: GTPase HflX [bacterium]
MENKIDKSIPRAILIDVVPPMYPKAEIADRLLEAESLVKTYGGLVVVKAMQRRGAPDYRTFIGSGKIEEIRKLAKELGATHLIINCQVKFRQIYALGEELRKDGIEVWDRIDLILKIFAKHARTTEAKLEIELASIRHMGPRIYGMGMELSRQGGGIGTSGVGETNTEIMKRHLKEKSRLLLGQISKYERVRETHRAARKRQGFQTVSIVGYTNAGKTSLLNSLTKRKEYAANELFATLDTRVGKMWLADAGKEILVSDTIGFIQDLPPELLKAFTSTLSEAVDADILIHVIDAADSKRDMKIEVVEDILARLGLENTPKIYVYNKIDIARKRFGKTEILEEFAEFDPQFVSAHKKTGLEELKSAIAKKILGIK